jgi:large subunit ribosomal protein L28
MALADSNGRPLMATVCEICGKHPGFGMKVSFSHKRSPRRLEPQYPAHPHPGEAHARRRNLCTPSIKANKVRRAV